jgi:hypothetical protein
MPYDEPDFSDPHELVGVALPAGEGAAEDMAYTYAEEFARMGLDAAAILDLFRNPFYGGAHQAYRALGDAAARAIVGECVAVWGRAVGRIHDAPASDVLLLPWPTVAPTPPIANEPVTKSQ